MTHGVRYVRQDIKYLSKEHNCPICNAPLSVVKSSKVINSNSEEAKDIPPIIPRVVVGGRGLKLRNYSGVGNIKWIWKEFKCPNCDHSFTVEQMKEIESAPKEKWEEMIASFDDKASQDSNELFDAKNEGNIEKNDSGKLKHSLLIAIPIIIVIIFAISITIALQPSQTFVDTNGADNFALTEITREDIIASTNSYRASAIVNTHSGARTNIVGGKLREYDRDVISVSFGKIYGIRILQATRILSDTLTLIISSHIESGNAEICIFVDGEYYVSVDLNQSRSITLRDISNKEVIVKLAGEDAKIKVEIHREY